MRTRVIFTLVIAAFTAYSVKADLGYLITNTDTIICDDVALGLKNANITLPDGEKVKVSKEEVQSYYVNGKKYDKLPVYLDGKPAGYSAFLELISQRNGLSLYKYQYFIESGVDATGKQITSVQEATALIVYKDNEYYLQVNKLNGPSLMKFFHVEGVSFE